jgi:GNAT superfamily N-acetyltransferase
MIQVAAAKEADRAAWQPLWQGYLDFYSRDLPADITDLTFMRALDPHEPVFLLLARDGERVVGFATFVLHRSTWARTHYLYLEDLFVDAAVRGTGAGRALVEHVIEIGRQNGCERVYWVTHEHNTGARALYEQMADLPGLVTYIARM